MSVRPNWDINDWKSRCSELALRIEDLEAENQRLREALDAIKSQPEPTGMVVPLDAFVDLMTKMLPDDTTDAFDQGVRAARLVAIDDAKALAVPAGNEWRPIETAPKDEVLVALWPDGDANVVTGRYAQNHGATYWMPLPEPPAQEAIDE
jgi:hypothetical protein